MIENIHDHVAGENDETIVIGGKWKVRDVKQLHKMLESFIYEQRRRERTSGHSNTVIFAANVLLDELERQIREVAQRGDILRNLPRRP